MISELAGALATIKTSSDLVKTVLDISKDVKVTSAITEVLRKLIEAQQSVLETQERFQQQAAELDDLRRQLRARDEWQEESKKYERLRLGEAQTVYRLWGDEPDVWYCPHCFTTAHRISFLQLWDPKDGTRTCHACHFQITPLGKGSIERQ
jgi:rubrerythrin